MRGKGLGDYSRKDGYGITPAYAGKSFAEWIDEQGEEDHPRLCGEKALSVEIHASTTGSPPPMRGKDDQRGQILHDHRITPAYAGKSPFEVRVILLREDHPRLCGEKTKAARRRLMGTGSPPPMRGKGYTDKSLTAMDRITPAYAGKSRQL